VLTDRARSEAGIFGLAMQQIAREPRRFGFESVEQQGISILRWTQGAQRR
jgi:hypothetical protein